MKYNAPLDNTKQIEQGFGFNDKQIRKLLDWHEPTLEMFITDVGHTMSSEGIEHRLTMVCFLNTIPKDMIP